MSSKTALRRHVRAGAENRPGIYRMFGPGDEPLYVGKSVRLRTRLLSYFRAPRGEKPWELIRDTQRIEWDYIPNEFFALISEMKLIQRWQPRFNVQHKRRRIYAFVKVTREQAPRVLPVTRITEDGATYYGPFPRVRALARTVREVAHVLGLRDCPATTPVFFDDQLEIFDAGRAPRCLRADLRSCLAPCCGRPTSVQYGDAVQLARRFLEGRAEAPLADLERQMNEAAARMDFEYAALLRDRLERLRAFSDEMVAFRGRVEDLTFVYRVPGFEGDDRVYLIRRGRIRKEVSLPKGKKARLAVARAVEEVYGEKDLGPGGLKPQEAAEILLVARWFRLNPEERRRTVAPDVWLAEQMGSRTRGRPVPTQ
ncbi:MAG: UvrB/UvrC motif-containing protein [Gemmatimonadota bacterium]|nr:UvrB/UvrC motif-containing protein [Gemmatimonadota bacterium]MDH3421486.1 UvrB/UvrC motif-containing protein [Gemmatimonadota bacterium]